MQSEQRKQPGYTFTVILQIFLIIFLTYFVLNLQCCYWSDMFTGRMRSEIPPALVNWLSHIAHGQTCTLFPFIKV